MKSVFYWSPILNSITGEFRLDCVRDNLPAYNFGDALGIEVMKRLQGKRFAYGPIKTADLFITGTVAPLIEMHGGAKEGAILAGVGTDPVKETKYDWQNKYDIRLVRGPLTRDKWGLAKDMPMGDPGLLTAELYGSFERKYRIGYIRDWKDRTKAPEELAATPGSITIDAGSAPEEVIPLIASCDRVITSSLHGAIVADSYGIPWQRHRAPVGLDMKWQDYSLSVEERGIERLKDDIRTVLAAL